MSRRLAVTKHVIGMLAAEDVVERSDWGSMAGTGIEQMSVLLDEAGLPGEAQSVRSLVRVVKLDDVVRTVSEVQRALMAKIEALILIDEELNRLVSQHELGDSAQVSLRIRRLELGRRLAEGASS